MEQEKLNKILEEHKKWLKTNGKKGQRADLHNTDLHYANFHSADLRGADLRSAYLQNANLSCAKLHSADLRSADLRGADLYSANLQRANLRSADLRYANLRDANLRDAELDYSAFPLWCGGLNVHLDDKQATQLLYHLIKNIQFSKNTSDELKKLLSTEALVEQANKFHRVDECGKLELINRSEEPKGYHNT